MLVVASRKIDKKNRIYHRCNCIYAKRIKMDNRKELTEKQAKKRQSRECSYCAGLEGDVRIHKKAIAIWERKKNMKFIYHKKSDTLYIQTTIGFWKEFMKEDLLEELVDGLCTHSCNELVRIVSRHVILLRLSSIELEILVL